MSFEILRTTYAAACPDLGPAAVDEIIAGALERARDKHPDFARFEPGMDYLAHFLFCAHSRLPLDDYLEALYCTVKHGDFSRAWRAELRRRQAAVVEEAPAAPVQ